MTERKRIVLSNRRVGEKIILREDLVLVIEKIEGNTVTIRKEVPEKDPSIFQEMWDKIRGDSGDPTSA